MESLDAKIKSPWRHVRKPCLIKKALRLGEQLGNLSSHKPSVRVRKPCLIKKALRPFLRSGVLKKTCAVRKPCLIKKALRLISASRFIFSIFEPREKTLPD